MNMTPKNEVELAEAVRDAAGPLRISGGGTRYIGRPVDGDALSTAGLSGISLYEPGALTLVAGAGTPVAEIEAALAVENQRLAFEPMDHRELLGTSGTPTIGGVVAANVSGPRRIAVGACRDHMLGVRFVDGTGTVLKNGGRVMKNVTGYDLVKLMSGSYGTLGVLSEVSLKVLPCPETSATLVLRDLTLAQSVAAMSAALGSPYEVTGAAMRGLNERQTCLRLEGFEASVAYRAEKLRDLLKDCGEIEVLGHGAGEALWANIRDVKDLAEHKAVTRVSINPGAAVDFAEAHWQTLGADLVMDWGGGLMWFGMTEAHAEDTRGQFGEDHPYSEDRGLGLIHGALQHALSPEILADAPETTSGHATLIKAPEAVRREVAVFQPEETTLASLSAGLRARFDPRGILNTGLMG